MTRPKIDGQADVAAALAGAAVHAETDNRMREARTIAAETTALPLANIRPRPSGDTRRPDPAHVVALAESIAALGLLEPLVIDQAGRLIAGRNRLEALRLLAIVDDAARVAAVVALGGKGALLDQVRDLVPPDWIARPVPCRRLPFDAVADPAAALAAEVAENQQRRDYTAPEIRALADRLRLAGFTERAGRPRKGERALKPALAAVVGRSLPTIERVMRDGETPSTDGVSPDPRAAARKVLERLAKQLPRDAEVLDMKGKAFASCRELAKGMRDLMGAIEEAREELKP